MSKSANAAIIIPARYGSTRFPGKPLTIIAGKSMLQRVCEVASRAAQDHANCQVVVATDDERIVQHVAELGYHAAMTDTHCKTGSDRALQACQQLPQQPDIVINLQGDAPLTPPHMVRAVLDTLLTNNDVQVATPVQRLPWAELDKLRQRKQNTPFSGTTVTIDSRGDAFWFSKQIVPVIRNEEKLRAASDLSPVHQHIGLYGFKYPTLQAFVELPLGHYEQLEQLEQLRLLENNIKIRTVSIELGDYPASSGVDTPADAQHVSDIIQRYGELLND